MSDPSPRHVLALLDDTALAGRVIEWSSVVAQELARPLEVVYVESLPALVAATLPMTRVLAPGGTQWAPFAPEDVERGYRAQAARVRALTARMTLHRAVDWTVRTVRGALLQVAVELRAESDLMLVGAAAGIAAPASPQRRSMRRGAVVAVVNDGSDAGRHAEAVARQVARALGGELVVRPAPDDAAVAAAIAGRCELLVLPRTLVAPGMLARLAQPVLLVG